MLTTLLLLTALAAPEPADDVVEDPPILVEATPTPSTAAEAEATAPEDEPRERSEYKWGGIGLPLVNYNNIDGLGFGVGAEVFDRRRDQDTGYRYKVSVATFWTTSGNFGSNFLQVERRGKHRMIARLVYRTWRNMLYTGSGGADIALNRDDIAGDNRIHGPSALINIIRSVPNSPVFVWFQGYTRYVIVNAAPGGILDTDRPFGFDGGFYFDTSAGIFIDEIDRWPLPYKGVQFELDARVGGTAVSGGFEPLFGVHAELIGYYPVVGKWLTIGMRSVFDKTFGERPWYEQEYIGGQLRDESGYEQTVTGYARYRPRGDGISATMIDVRQLLGRTRHPTADMAFYVSGFAEMAWVFRKNDPGPPLPSVGFAPTFLWQQAVVLRPFISWGWIAETQGGVRLPTSQVGISLLGPL